MYTKFFGLSGLPFEPSPQPGFLFLTAQHARAISSIEFALMNRDSFVIISGEVGIGKTTILNKIASELPKNFCLARVTHTTLTPVELIQSILSAFGIPSYRRNKIYLLDRLREFLWSLDSEGKHAVIMVDEAQNLSFDSLEELRLLSCIDGDEKVLSSSILVGQPALNRLIDSERLANLRDRTRLRQHLEALNSSDTANYIRHRLEVVGGEFDRIFEPGITERIYQVSRGIPRRINTVCDTALAIACLEDKRTIDSDIVSLTLAELKLEQTDTLSSGRSTSEQQARTPSDRTDEVVAPLKGDRGNGKTPRFAVYHEQHFDGFFSVGHVPFLLGRNEANSYLMKCPSVSRHHAVIVRYKGELVIEDLQSTNGMQVNATNCKRRILRYGDVVSIGKFALLYCPDELPAGQPQPKTG